jgi:hypothetical protein
MAMGRRRLGRAVDAVRAKPDLAFASARIGLGTGVKPRFRERANAGKAGAGSTPMVGGNQPAYREPMGSERCPVPAGLKLQ